MTWTLVWTRPALRDMKKLDQVLARRVRDAVIGLAGTGRGETSRSSGIRGRRSGA